MPNFDAGSVRRARPAVPLTRADGRPSTLTWAVVALCAGMVGGLLGILVLNSYQSKQAARQSVESAPAGARGEVVAATPGDASGADGARTTEAAVPEATDATRPAETTASAPAGGDEAAQLRAALGAWVAATNARDIERQMEFYDSRVGVYYLSRNASRAAVRAEKSNAFARASAVDVRADDPQITLAPDGRTATMRFRKQYAIEGAGQERRGAVLQELRWRRTPAGWKITGERDLLVVN
ncbi:MAG: nuclear transport factor 2 family protein [Acidobacteria bacterium]|nr:nuclear transport factor 2 family protein [Acidobacteriota bacterium]